MHRRPVAMPSLRGAARADGGIIVRITNLIAITVFLTYTAALTPKRIALLETLAAARALVVFVVVVGIIEIGIFGRI